MKKRPVGKFTKHQLFKIEYQEPGECRRMCRNRDCRRMFTMIEKDQSWCTEECREILEEKWERLELIRKLRSEAN